MHIGSWHFPNPVFVAPMAGVTDRPYRKLCKQLGAGHAVSEMAASNADLWHSVKTARRTNHDGELDPITVQLAGSDPDMLAQAAVFNIGKGARIIDINMGCPMKKVCRAASGSALLRDEALVAQILNKVVQACRPYDVHVTVKIRTGWDAKSRNAVQIAKIAQDAGIAAIAIHGRTRCDLYKGEAEYDTIRQVKQAVEIPIIANGDINSPEKAQQVLQTTGADAIMIGRAAQGRPWIFREVFHYLQTQEHRPPPTYGELHEVLLSHLDDHYTFYGNDTGVRSARKHIAWYLRDLPDAKQWLPRIHKISEAAQQSKALDHWLQQYPANEFLTSH